VDSTFGAEINNFNEIVSTLSKKLKKPTISET